MKGEPQQAWLKAMTYGYAEGSHFYCLMESPHFAIVVSPGGRWSDNSGQHYGAITYYIVEKTSTRGGTMRNSRTVGSGGKVNKGRRERWQKMLDASEEAGELVFIE